MDADEAGSALLRIALTATATVLAVCDQHVAAVSALAAYAGAWLLLREPTIRAD